MLYLLTYRTSFSAWKACTKMRVLEYWGPSSPRYSLFMSSQMLIHSHLMWDTGQVKESRVLFLSWFSYDLAIWIYDTKYILTEHKRWEHLSCITQGSETQRLMWIRLVSLLRKLPQTTNTNYEESELLLQIPSAQNFGPFPCFHCSLSNSISQKCSDTIV